MDVPCMILQLKKGIAWNRQPLRHSVQSVFFKSNILFVLLTLQIKYQVQANHDPINLPKTVCPPSAMKSFPPYFMGQDTILLDVSLNICEKVQNKTC